MTTRRSMVPFFLFLVFAFLLCFAGTVSIRAVEIKPKKESGAAISAQASQGENEQPMPSKEELLGVRASDIVVGDVNAPITVFEYSSLACPHCATFHKEDFPKLKADYIDKGLVRYIHRDFPTTQPALTASVIARCSGRYEVFLDVFFNSQIHWAFNPNYKEILRNIARLAGMEKAQFDTCINNIDAADTVYKNTFYASKVLNVKATPTFLVNGELIEGGKYSVLASALNSKLEAQGSSKPTSAP